MISAIVWIVLVYHVCPAFSSCDRQSTGQEDCISIGRYYKYQYGTCLTDAYIQQKSNHKHQCEDRTATYCHYQCMLELYDVNSGHVTDDCACGVDAPTGPSESIIRTTPIPLDPGCYSPDGTECSWYRSCLEKRFPCSELNQSYALDYGEKFCNLYTEHYTSFDDVGKRWVDAVRKCLQVALVPLVRSFNTVPCEQIKNVAFGSHTGCYVSPPDGARSFCYIGFMNVFRVLATIRSAFIQWDNIWGTITQSYSTVKSCMSRYVKDAVARERNMMQVNTHVNEGQQLNNTAQMRFDLERELSAQMGHGVFVYAFPELPDSRTRRSPQNITVIVTNVLVLPRAGYDLNYHSNETVNVTDVVDGFLDGLADGSIQLSLPWSIQDIRQCDGVECEHPTRTVVPKVIAKTNDDNKSDGHNSICVIIGAIVGGCALAIITISILVWWKCRK